MPYENILGKDVLLEFMKEDEYVPFVCVENFSMEFTQATKETKTVGTGPWSRPRFSRNSFSISVSGLIPLTEDPADFKPFELLDYLIGGSEIQFRAIWQTGPSEMKVIYGTVIVTTALLTGNATDFANASFTLPGVGEPTITTTVEICEAEIGTGLFDVTVTNEGGGPVTITINVVTGSPDHYDWSVDGGGVNSAYSNSWYVGGISAGDHVLEITPICANGQPGTVRIVNFSSA